MRGIPIALAVGVFAVLQVQPVHGNAAALRAKGGHVCVFDHLMLTSAPGTCRPLAKSYPPSVGGPVRRAIYDAALTFGIPYRILLRIAFCESALHPWAVNGTHYGLFQFYPATFIRGELLMRSETGIVSSSYWDARDASYVAGYLFATGHARRWACEPPAGPPPPGQA